MGRIATLGLKPNRTFLLDIDSAQGLKRSGDGDRMERKSLKFHRAVRKGFLSLARREKRRVKVIDASQGIREVQKELEKVLKRDFQ